MAEAAFRTAGRLSVHSLSVLCALTSSGSRAQEKLLPPARVGWDKQGCRSLNVTSQEAREDSLDKVF